MGKRSRLAVLCYCFPRRPPPVWATKLNLKPVAVSRAPVVCEVRPVPARRRALQWPSAPVGDVHLTSIIGWRGDSCVLSPLPPFRCLGGRVNRVFAAAARRRLGSPAPLRCAGFRFTQGMHPLIGMSLAVSDRSSFVAASNHSSQRWSRFRWCLADSEPPRTKGFA